MTTQDRCQGTTLQGKPCNAAPRPGSSWCPWHDPAMASERPAWRVKGGANSSNANRARKAIKGDLRDLAGVKATLLTAMGKVERNELEPAQANAIANLARAVVVVAGVADFQDELTDLRRQLSEMREDRTGA